jgi:GR25 family glycosyltransferase involved in LPS biosynthesis
MDIPIYVISLSDAEIRRRNIAARLNAAGLAFQFFDAADGRCSRFPDVIDGARITRACFGTEGGLGSTVSHRLVHRKIANGKAEMALVLEDDALPAPDFRDVLSCAARFDFDVFKFEGDPLGVRIKVGQIGKYAVVIGTTVALGGAAYLIRRSAAAKFCSLPQIDQMVDAAFSDERLGLRVLQCEPYPVVQDRATPTTVRVNFSGYFPNAKRPDSLQRMAGLISRRYMLLKVYGPKIAIRLELQKVLRRLSRLRERLAIRL